VPRPAGGATLRTDGTCAPRSCGPGAISGGRRDAAGARSSGGAASPGPARGHQPWRPQLSAPSSAKSLARSCGGGGGRGGSCVYTGARAGLSGPRRVQAAHIPQAAEVRGRRRLGAGGPDAAKIDLLLVGDVTVQYLADIIQKVFSTTAKLTITICDMKKAAALGDKAAFNMVFLKMTSLTTAEELEAIKLIRFGRTKDTRLLIVFIVPENFKGYGVDIILTEPLTMEKMSVVVKYWKTYFSNTESLRNDTGFELKSPLSNFEKNKKISLLHSSKEKLRRERIKCCCEQLRILLPYVKGRKSDVASILEATVDYVKYVREKIPPVIMSQITEALQSNRKFCKKQQTPIQLSDPAQSWHRGQSSYASESAIGDKYKTQVSTTSLSVNSFPAVRYYSKVISSCDAAAVTNQNISVHLPSAMPKVSKFLPQHCTSVLGQTSTTHPKCL
ncbi:LOW QUALITY PROTEIN: Spermatogenesis- and oogenesis-specific basic helix-loop-helix-containing protein 2, partial [Galemys pyrenaicus]